MNLHPFRAISALVVALVAIAPALSTIPAASNAALDPVNASRLLAFDCERLDASTTQILRAMPAPRIILLQGSVPIVTMEAFAQFLINMGYPETSLRDPRDGTLSRSSFTSSASVAGIVAWHYEREGLRPMLIGHSQGGMMVVRTLHELSGTFNDAVAVWDPVTGAAQPRTTIRDPYANIDTPVVGLKVSFAAALATGTLPRVLLGQWTMLPLLRKIPDSVDEFTGFAIPWDPIAGTLGSPDPYAAIGGATVRNVVLPGSYTHIGLPRTEHLAAQPVTRDWIDNYTPGQPVLQPETAAVDTTNLLHAADLWFSIRHHWCLEGQRRLRAERHS
jgi:hypothetical protein